MKTSITASINLATRPAIYTPACNRPNFGLIKGEKYDVDVFGVYQIQIEDEIDAYFVLTLPDGRCTYVGIESIQFTDMGEQDETTNSN